MKVIAITPDRKFDAVAPSVIEGLYDLGAEEIASDPGNGVKRVYSDDEIVSHSRDADFVFAFWGKIRGNRPPKYYLLDRINRPDITAYVDGSEWTCTGYQDTNEKIFAPWVGKEINKQIFEAKNNPSRCKGSPWINKSMLAYCKWYFKRECYWEDYESGIIPFNVGCINKYFGNFQNIEKEIDIFCSYGHVMTGLRHETEIICKKLKKEGFNVVFAQNLSHEEYLKTIAKSYISVSAWGAGNSCMRLWESMANKTCCFRQKTIIEFPNEPVDGEHCVVYSSPEEFEKKIRWYLKNKDICVKIGQKGFDHAVKYHSSRAKVEYMLDIMKQNREV